MTEPLGQITLEVTGGIIESSSARFSRREQLIAIIGVLLAFAAFWFAGKLFGIPAYTHVSASLIQQPTPITTFFVTFIVYGACILLGSVVAGTVGFDAGIFCASIGLCALSIRGGAMRFTLFDAHGPDVWIKLAGECVILGALAAGGFFLQHLLLQYGLLHGDDHRHVVTEVHRSTDQRLLALVTTVLVMTVSMMLFTATDRKAQAIISVGVSSFLATLAAYFLVPTKPSAWYWSAPIIVGIVGYLIQYFGKIDGWQIGEVRGTFAALARPLPLDYAGSGVASAIVGYWISRRWQHEREISTVTGPATS